MSMNLTNINVCLSKVQAKHILEQQIKPAWQLAILSQHCTIGETTNEKEIV